MDSTFCASLFTIFLLLQICNSIDTITSTQFTSDAKNETLLSSDGTFRLGFFRPSNISLNRYVGIWFDKVAVQNIVWVANRDTPLLNKEGVFKITKDGNIAVFSNKNETEPLWSSNVSVAKNITNSIATLLSTGNLVLTVTKGSSDRGKRIIWQSFDYPTDTILAGMKFGVDRRTGLNRVITSWKTEDDPAGGEYSVGWKANGLPQYYVYKNSVPLWRAGPWNGLTLSGVPILAKRLKAGEVDYSNAAPVFNYSYIDNEDEVYTIYEAPFPKIFRKYLVEPKGTLQGSLWRTDRDMKTKEWVRFWFAPADLCDRYMRCGRSTVCNSTNEIECACLPGYESNYTDDWDINCRDKTKEARICGKGNGEGFIKLADIKLPDATVARHFANLSLEDCELECLKSCNCTGYASANINAGGRGCYAWYGELNDIRAYVDGQDFYIRVDALELENYERNNSNTTGGRKRMQAIIIIIILTVVPGVLLLFCCSLYYARRKHVLRKGQLRKQRYREMILAKSDTDLINDSSISNNVGDNRNIDLTFFDLDTIKRATDHFSPARKLGQGSFGPVYKGELSNGQEIAVKRLLKTSRQGISELKNEAVLIAKLQHMNLVSLLGCCIEDEEKLLIYEYMPNKSLDYFIFGDESKKSLLNWRKRHEIIVGIARGILYLHQDSRIKIIHRDLKASNILLDEELNPKISDFGTAKIFGRNQMEANTSRVIGTFGYMSPEYALGGLFSVKSDIFSFGVLLLEIISGKKNNRVFHDIPNSSLIKHVWEQWSNGRALEIADTSMGDSFPGNEVLRCIQVGLLCVQDNTTDRPTMSAVIFMLSNELATLPSPKQPMVAVYSSHDDMDTAATGTKSCSINRITITQLTAR